MAKSKFQVCIECEERKSTTRDYYKAKESPIFSKEVIPICKECIQKKIESAETEEEEFSILQATLKLVDKPLLSEVYKGDFQAYMRVVQSLPQYRTKTYEDSDLFNQSNINLPSGDTLKLKKMSEEEFKTAERVWGAGKTEEEYLFLINEWFEYDANYGINSKSMDVYVKQICLTELDIIRERNAGKNIQKLLETLDKLLQSANLKPVQEADGVSGHEAYGTFIKKIEMERPISEPLEEWKDVDGIGKNTRVWFTGMLQESLGLHNEFQEEFDETIEEYSVKREEE